MMNGIVKITPTKDKQSQACVIALMYAPSLSRNLSELFALVSIFSNTPTECGRLALKYRLPHP